jgi:hypothetical protein
MFHHDAWLIIIDRSVFLMSTPTATALPDGWTIDPNDPNTAVAPDGNKATGDVLTFVTDTETKVADLMTQVATLTAEVTSLQSGGTGGNPGTGPTQAAFDALTAQVTALATAQTQQNVLAVAMQAALSLDEATLKAEPQTILQTLAAAIQAAELSTATPPSTSTTPSTSSF